MSVHVSKLGLLGLSYLSFPKVFDSKKYILPGARSHSGVVYYLVGQGHRGAIREGGWLIAPLQEKG